MQSFPLSAAHQKLISSFIVIAPIRYQSIKKIVSHHHKVSLLHITTALAQLRVLFSPPPAGVSTL
jgi:hypothetical protein